MLRAALEEVLGLPQQLKPSHVVVVVDTALGVLCVSVKASPKLHPLSPVLISDSGTQRRVINCGHVQMRRKGLYGVHGYMVGVLRRCCSYCFGLLVGGNVWTVLLSSFALALSGASLA